MRLRLGLALLLLTPAAACSDEFPSERLRERVAAHLEAHRDTLRETLGHYALVYPVEPAELESLGLLLAEPSLVWAPDERRRARAWLAGLEAAAFADLSSVPLVRLAHAARGLALVSQHRARLE